MSKSVPSNMASTGHTSVTKTDKMPAFCCVINCGSRGERDNVKFYVIPKILNFKHKEHINHLSKVRRQKWIHAINRKDLTESKQKYATVCSKHFISGKPADREDNTNPDWVPNLNLGHGDKIESKSLGEFVERSQKRRKLKQEDVDETVHFEENQWESRRADGAKKLLPNAIPTLFDTTNVASKRKSKIKHSAMEVTAPFLENDKIQVTETSVASSEILNQQVNKIRQKEIAILKKKLEDTNALFRTFLTTEQISALKRAPHEWSHQSVIMSYKLRFNLGIHGYNYLQSTGYPIPSYSTLLKHLESMRISFGIFDSLLEPLKCKVETLEDKKCVLCIDEMDVSGDIDFDDSQQKLFGQVTMGSKSSVGTHITLALIRGIKHLWSQIIACEITGPSTSGKLMKQFVEKCINFTERCGLHVTAISSDMGTNNQALWSQLGINITKEVESRNNKFVHNGHNVYIVADVCDLLKKLKHTVLELGLQLPRTLVESEDLHSDFVHGSHIYKLFELEVSKGEDLRTLHHLKGEDFHKTNVSAAASFFSEKTAGALELAVQLETLPPAALTTAFFCRLIDRWFSICASKDPKASITWKNKLSELEFLAQIIEIFNNIKIGNGWKPLNSGVILSTLSLCNITEMLIEDKYTFIPLHRFTQDALRNVFSQIREKTGLHPSALQCLETIKLITFSQFASDVKRSYLNDDVDCFEKESCMEELSSSTLDSRPPHFDEHDYFLSKTEETDCDAELDYSFVETSLELNIGMEDRSFANS